ncbi:MAG: malto-oligosyltrehalose synthase [Candidatus Dormiibacterota bacterium]
MRANPRATYRVQLREEFDFDAAAATVPYLEELGISHLYCSPYMQAAEHSAHGYDVVDPTRVSTALGGEPGLRRLDHALRAAQMGQLLDTVPNHMCITERANTWWWDVLRHGRGSPYSPFFDIDWEASASQGRVLLPVLGAPRAELLAAGALQVVRGADGGFELHYEANAFPLAPGTAVTSGPVSLETLDAQHYILEDSRTGAAHVNYRRFFDVSSLAGVCVDVSSVFDTVLARALELVKDGTVDGLRVDHIDGLRDPAAFASRLRSQAPAAWLVVEKILATGEQLPVDWPIDGTTGYEFGALLTSLMVHPGGLSEVSECYRQYTGDSGDFPVHSHRARSEVLETVLSAELSRLIRVAAAAGVDDARSELVELAAGMPRYRVYPRAGAPLSIDDERAIAAAEEWARQSGRCDEQRLDALLAALRGEDGRSAASGELRERFQQVAGAVMAKGVEDTAFYRSVRLVALNEVGADPERTSRLDEFHAWCAQNSSRHPLTLLATTTHDTKRAEDARLRVGLLSEMPQRWRDAVARLDVVGARHRGAHPPSREAEYLFYQTMVAAHPLDVDRAWAYMLKAAREAKLETNWVEPNQHYEAHLEHFVDAMMSDPDVQAVIGELVASMTPEWQTLSLSQTLIKLTAPGIPDIYQGSELWDLRLVDPDNREPVDYEVRRRLLRAVMADHGSFMSRLAEGGPKLRLIATALAVRARNPEAYDIGSGYQRVVAIGARADHAICFVRTRADEQPVTVTIAFRWPLLLRPGWLETLVHLPDGRWRDALTGHEVRGGEQRLATLLDEAPVALLERA